MYVNLLLPPDKEMFSKDPMFQCTFKKNFIRWEGDVTLLFDLISPSQLCKSSWAKIKFGNTYNNGVNKKI